MSEKCEKFSVGDWFGSGAAEFGIFSEEGRHSASPGKRSHLTVVQAVVALAIDKTRCFPEFLSRKPRLNAHSWGWV